MLWLAVRHPLAVVADMRARGRWRGAENVVALRMLAPVAWRLRRAGVRHLHAHFANEIALDALRLSRLCGIPYSVTAHAYEIYQQPRNLAEKLERAAFVTSGCDYTVRDLRGLVAAPARERVHRIVMGVDATRFERGTPYPGGRTVVAVGRLVEKKGFADLIAACGLLTGPDALEHLVIAGTGRSARRSRRCASASDWWRPSSSRAR